MHGFFSLETETDDGTSVHSSMWFDVEILRRAAAENKDKDSSMSYKSLTLDGAVLESFQVDGMRAAPPLTWSMFERRCSPAAASERMIHWYCPIMVRLLKPAGVGHWPRCSGDSAVTAICVQMTGDSNMRTANLSIRNIFCPTMPGQDCIDMLLHLAGKRKGDDSESTDLSSIRQLCKRSSEIDPDVDEAFFDSSLSLSKDTVSHGRLCSVAMPLFAKSSKFTTFNTMSDIGPGGILGFFLLAQRVSSGFSPSLDHWSRMSSQTRRSFESGIWCHSAIEMLRKSSAMLQPLLAIERVSKVIRESLLAIDDRKKVQQNEMIVVERASTTMWLGMENRQNRGTDVNVAVSLVRDVMRKSEVAALYLNPEGRQNENICHALYEFDPPNRKPNLVATTILLPRGTQNYHLQKFPGGGDKSLAEQESGFDTERLDNALWGTAGNSDMNDAAYNNFSATDWNVLDAFIDLAQNKCDSYPHDEETQKAAVESKLHASVSLHGGNSAFEETISLAHDRLQSHIPQKDTRMMDAVVAVDAPDALICPSWALELAQRCLVIERAAIFIPPPLSVLPSIAIVTSSFLAAAQQNHRVLMVCLGSAEMAEYLRLYFEDVFQGDYHIEIELRECLNKDGHGEELEAVGLRTTQAARLLITRDFHAASQGAFSCLFVLCQSDLEVAPRRQAASRSQKMPISINVDWNQFNCVFVAPYPTCTNLTAYGMQVESLCSQLHVPHAVMLDEAKEDVQASVFLSRPDSVFLVPTQDAQVSLRIIDQAAVPLIARLWHDNELLSNVGRVRDFIEGNSPPSLRDLAPNDIEKMLRRKAGEEPPGCQVLLEFLYALRHARSYALNDGIGTAIAYLRQLLTAHTGQHDFEQLIASLQEIENRSKSDLQATRHPIVPPIIRILASEREKMNEEPRAVAGTRLCKNFRPLIITDSLQGAEGLLSGLPAATDILECTKDDIAICNRERLEGNTKGRKRALRNDGADLYRSFSIILYVLDGRGGKEVLNKLPRGILQLSHAGSLKLISVMVDESRILERVAQENVALHLSFRKTFASQQSADGHPGNILQSSLGEALCSLSRVTTESDWNKHRGDTECQAADQQIKWARDAGSNQHRVYKYGNHSEFHITAGVLLRFKSTRELSVVLHEKLRYGDDYGLVVHVLISRSEKCSPATTFLHAAIAQDQYLYDRVRVYIHMRE